ncbi:MAG: hypothetical protein KGD74_07855 [Candidatus Lokiarchaeota archaeon]|nr:hypothetical protein [Candidatus Lokiarchaeota archaeon]
MIKIKTNKKNLIILLTFATLLSALSLPLAANANSVDLRTSDITPKSSQIIPRTVRVAIYDDANVTRPSYASAALLTNNYSNIQTALLAAGYEVTPLTTNQIYNHELKNARYDVFIMADHLPKTNITNYVKEYWLGGGTLLSMDSALNYICYAGILPPESAGDDGNGIYWTYQFSSVQNITMRHPISKSYAVNDSFTIDGLQSSATFSWSALQGTSIASELVKIATKPGSPDAATVVAYDPQSGGGRVVHLPSPRELGDDAILIDALDWLCPRPKGRILFDLSHFPYYGIDAWDLPYADYAPRYEILRNNLVNRSYTIDKLYPSAIGNLTSSNLAPYDVLFLALSNVNFTASEITAVTNWINNGGSLLLTGETTGLNEYNLRVNDLLVNFDLKMNTTASGSGTATYTVAHPTLEGCSQISTSAPGKIVYDGEAFPIWGADADNIFVAGQEYGNGRILLFSDLAPLRDSSIMSFDNLQYAINAVNWLTSGNAGVLVYVDEPISPNYYRTPVTNALNELGINFYLTFKDEYLNLSLNLYNWELVVIDNPIYDIVPSVLTEVHNFVKGGGRLIMSSYRVNYYITHPLWAGLGFAYDQDQPDTSSLYIWDAAHPIFNTLIGYGAARFDPVEDYGNEGDLLMVYPNATALAGYTASETENNTNIVLGNNGNTLYNAYLIDQFSGDLDDSTYADNIELWINEITYMLRPGSFSLSSDADNPDDDGIFNLSWTVSSEVTEYDIYQHTSFITDLTGAEILIAGGVITNINPLTGLTNGTYYFIVESTNSYGKTLSNCIEITVAIPPSPPGLPSGGIPGYELISLISTILIATSVLALIGFKRNRCRQ